MKIMPFAVRCVAACLTAALAGCPNPDPGAGGTPPKEAKNAVEAARQSTQDAMNKAGETTREAVEKATGAVDAGAGPAQSPGTPGGEKPGHGAEK